MTTHPSSAGAGAGAEAGGGAGTEAGGGAVPSGAGEASEAAAAAGAGRVQRFDGVTRLVHWANAALFLFLVVTGLVLSFGPLSTLVGRRALVGQLHVWAGLALPVPLVAGLVGRWGSGLRAEVRALNRWLADDRRWFRSFGRARGIRIGKFHPGQKLNAAFTAGAIPVMLATGSIMRWNSPFPLAWRTGATFVHDWLATALLLTIAGHIVKALSEPEAMGGMLRGHVDTRWAARRHPRWLDQP